MGQPKANMRNIKVVIQGEVKGTYSQDKVVAAMRAGHMDGATFFDAQGGGLVTPDELRSGSLMTKPWDGSTGGFGYSDWGPTPDQWKPGVYTVQIFVGHDFKRGDSFTVEGEAPTAAPTLSPTPTPSTLTPSP